MNFNPSIFVQSKVFLPINIKSGTIDNCKLFDVNSVDAPLAEEFVKLLDEINLGVSKNGIQHFDEIFWI